MKIFPLNIRFAYNLLLLDHEHNLLCSPYSYSFCYFYYTQKAVKFNVDFYSFSISIYFLQPISSAPQKLIRVPYSLSKIHTLSYFQFPNTTHERNFFQVPKRLFPVQYLPCNELGDSSLHITCYPSYLILSTSVSFFRLLLKTQESTICNRPTKKIIIKIGTIGT